MALYQVNNFSFSYPLQTQKINHSGDFKIAAGDCVLIQGASGSGKSTLLAAFKGLIPHLIHGTLCGEILLDGIHIQDLTEQRLLKIAYLQQNPSAQQICQDVFSELAFGLENLGLTPTQIKAKIVTMATQFNLTHLLTRENRHLSDGEKQKINLFALLLLDPEVLLLDEPTAFLDPVSAKQIMDILQQIKAQKTIIIVEHNWHYIHKLIDYVINIDRNGNLSSQSNYQWPSPLKKSTPLVSKIKPILSIRQLNFKYLAQKPLINNLNLEIYPGEIIAIKGANGVGKSTLLKLIAGILPSKNMIFLYNQDITTLKKAQLWQQISLVWQNPEAHFLYSSVSNELDNNQQLIEQFNLHAQQNQNPFCLSEGQKRRLSLAIALQQKTPILLLDEPSFGQDRLNKEILQQQLYSLANNGHAIIMLSHDEEFINACATNSYYLVAGELHSC